MWKDGILTCSPSPPPRESHTPLPSIHPSVRPKPRAASGRGYFGRSKGFKASDISGFRAEGTHRRRRRKRGEGGRGGEKGDWKGEVERGREGKGEEGGGEGEEEGEGRGRKGIGVRGGGERGRGRSLPPRKDRVFPKWGRGESEQKLTVPGCRGRCPVRRMSPREGRQEPRTSAHLQVQEEETLKLSKSS